ncbi:hypothetical protein GWO09_30350 [candidate division KSB1 bacterium]|nr:hypothetical protein [candidate division KSB1 bacterium]
MANSISKTLIGAEKEVTILRRKLILVIALALLALASFAFTRVDFADVNEKEECATTASCCSQDK